MRSLSLAVLSFLVSASLSAQSKVAQQASVNPWMVLMEHAKAHAVAHGAHTPLLSPLDRTVAPAAFGLPAETVAVPVTELQAKGIRVVPWTTNDPEKMRAVIRTGVDGLISDRPDILQHVLTEERALRPTDPKLANFVVSAHRGGRGLRPENTLPSFESGLDQLATELETDTGVSTDHVSLIWHDQFYNPQSCRHADGSPYTQDNRVYLRDISSNEAQKTFICDKLHFGPDQKNDPALSPVAVAFAAREHLVSPYVPTYVEQLFRFVDFYATYYSSTLGSSQPDAARRAANARTVRFNLETKILPPSTAQSSDAAKKLPPNHTVDPQTFVATLAGVITKAGMADRCAIQSFDFRTLVLVEEQFPKIPTFYLTESTPPPAL